MYLRFSEHFPGEGAPGYPSKGLLLSPKRGLAGERGRGQGWSLEKFCAFSKGETPG